MTRKLSRRAVIGGSVALAGAARIDGNDDDRPSFDDVFVVKGWIKWFDAEKGYGFIRCEDDLPDVLLHVGCLRNSGFDTAYENAVVAAEVMLRPKGLQAIRVIAMGAEPMGPPKPRLHLAQNCALTGAGMG